MQRSSGSSAAQGRGTAELRRGVAMLGSGLRWRAKVAAAWRVKCREGRRR